MRQRISKPTNDDRPRHGTGPASGASQAAVCDNCSAPFKPLRSWSRFCSEPCRRSYSRTVYALASELASRPFGERVLIRVQRGGPTIERELEIPPASRRTDPDTSKEAEARVDIKRQAERLEEALRLFGPATMHEIARADGMPYYTCQRRISILRKNGLAVPAGTRVDKVTGRRCTVWRAA